MEVSALKFLLWERGLLWNDVIQELHFIKSTQIIIINKPTLYISGYGAFVTDVFACAIIMV